MIDVAVRQWTDDEIAILSDLADIAMDEIRLHVHDRIAALRRDWRGSTDHGPAHDPEGTSSPLAVRATSMLPAFVFE